MGLSWKTFFLPGLLLVGALLRLSSAHGLWNGEQLHFYDPDSFYQLRRLLYFLENFPSALYFDPLINWPWGAEVRWSEIFTWAMGFPLWMLGLSSQTAMEWGATLQTLFWGLACVVLSYSVGKKLANEKVGLFAAFLSATSIGMIKFSCVGVFDHHVFEILFSLVFLRWIISAQREHAWHSLLGGFLVFFFLSLSIANFIPATAGFSVIFVLLCRREWPIQSVLLFSISLLSFSFGYSFWRASFSEEAFSFARFSYFHSAFLAGICGGLLWRAYSKNWLTFGMGIAVMIASILGALLGLESFSNAANTTFQYLFVRSGSLSLIEEASPVWMTHQAWNLSFIFAFFGLISFVPLGLLWKRRELRSQDILLILYVLLMLIPCLSQKRFSHLLLGPLFVLSAITLDVFVRSLDLRKTRLAWVLAALLAVSPYFFFKPIPGLEARHLLELSLYERLKTHLPYLEAKSVNEALSSDEVLRSAFYAEPNLGSFLLYRTGRPVVVNSFFLSNSIHTDLELRLIESKEDLFSEMRRLNIGFAMLQDDWLYFRGLHLMKDRSFKDYGELKRDGSLVLNGDAMNRLAWVRLVRGTEPAPRQVLERFEFQYQFPYNQIVLLRP